MADNTGLFGDGMMGGYGNNITAANIIRSRYRQPIAQAAMENVDPYQQFLRRPENSVLPDWMSNSSSNSVMGKIDPNDPYSIEQARNANPTANEEAGLEMPMLADPYNYVGMGLGTGAANAVGKFVAPKANEMLENYMVKSGMQLPATVWHGSPHKFDKFDFSKIGTGEGAQAYGHGGYSAGNPNVAIQYQHMLSKPEFSVNAQGLTMRGDLPRMMDEAHGELISSHGVQQTQTSDVVDRVRERLDRQMQDALKANDMPWFSKVADMKMDLNRYLENPPPNPGYLYKIDLPDEHIAKMLDWDKPLSQQHPDVQAALGALPSHRRILGDTLESNGKWVSGAPSGELTGREAYLLHQLQSDSQHTRGSQAMASESLRQAGIPGIKYRDSGSRLNYTVQNFHKGTPYGEPVSFATDKQAKDYSAEQIQKGFETKVDPGTSNYVVFPGNEDMLTILERNNQPLVNALRSK